MNCAKKKSLLVESIFIDLANVFVNRLIYQKDYIFTHLHLKIVSSIYVYMQENVLTVYKSVPIYLKLNSRACPNKLSTFSNFFARQFSVLNLYKSYIIKKMLLFMFVFPAKNVFFLCFLFCFLYGKYVKVTNDEHQKCL